MRRLLCVGLALFLVLVYRSEYVEAVPVEESQDSDIIRENAALLISDYEVTNENIVPGENFTLTITVTNYSSDVTAKSVSLAIKNPEGVAPIYGTVSQSYIGTLKPGTSKKVMFDYNSSTTIVSDILNFGVTVTSDSAYNDVTLKIPSSLDSPFKVEKVSIPESSYAGETAEVSIAFSILGLDNVSNIVMCIVEDGIEKDSTSIGILTPGATRNQTMSVKFDSPGEHPIDICFRYTDISGIAQEHTAYSGTVVVLEGVDTSEIVSASAEAVGIVKPRISRLIIVGAGGIVILLLVGMTFLLINKNRYR